MPSVLVGSSIVGPDARVGVNQRSQADYISAAREMLQVAYAQLPPKYFDAKNAGCYMFNNILRLVESYPAVPRASASAIIEADLKDSEAVGLYAGVPWCEEICSFCNFAYSTSTSPETHRSYISSITRELGHLKQLGLPRVNSLYFGGGTPTILSDALFAEYLDALISSVDLAPRGGITCEGTINTMTSSKMDIMLDHGVNRVSMGVQSLDPQVREQAKLRGSAEQARDVVELACSRFKMVNVDLIYGHPYQSAESWYESVRQCAELRVPSITLYRLEVKERTSNLKLYRKDQGVFSTELAARHQYFVAKLLLEDLGYVEHPLGWWIRKESHAVDANWRQHLSGWIKAISYIGVGQGAFSLCRRAYLENPRRGRDWASRVEAAEVPAEVCKPFGPEVNLLLQILRVLRSALRVALSTIAEPLSSFGLLEGIKDVLDRNVEYGLLEKGTDEYALTDCGRSLVHWLLDDLVSACCQQRLQ